jgi:hypothetical protein
VIEKDTNSPAYPLCNIWQDQITSKPNRKT